MSRIGKLPIEIPAGVEVNIKGNLVEVKGPKGQLSQEIASSGISAKIEDGQVLVSRATEQKRHKAMHGLYRQLIANMIEGVSQGYKVELELHGVGYRASNKGQLLELALGYSHPVMFYLPEEVSVTTETKKGTAPLVTLESFDKQLIGQVAAKIRSFRKPEPYKGKGVRFKGEQIRRKAGKTAAK
ncbi:50S ribosomal protein L6 [Saprospira grandis]|uniref:50S ribosomal protein L6 n=1 Tax=Saprospira grandis TaxID=1008 RepID=UPI0022DD88B0|nr:50S ribosomal protein L6 [Saprospira grandis]WBM76003.1 50S ribosomal protein L6 [Saprospira grandis]